MMEQYFKTYIETVISLEIVLFLVLVAWIITELFSVDYCKDGNSHCYEFLRRSNGRTGDLGFGIRSAWEVDTFKCKKCGRKKEFWNY